MSGVGSRKRRYVRSAPGLPAAAAPISHAVVAGNHCYVSGQLAVDANGKFRSGSAAQEARIAFRNLFRALHASGFRKTELVFVEIVFANLADLPKVNALFAKLFPRGRRPARTVSQAAALPYGAKIKVHGVAVDA